MENKVLFAILAFITYLVSATTVALFQDKYIKDFKQKLIKPLLVSINQTIEYFPEKAIPRFIFDKSNLFGNYNKYDGDDLMTGDVDGVKFTLSELHIFSEKKVNNNTVQVHIFEGIFSEFEFNKHFDSTTLIYPDVAQKYFGNLGLWLQKMNFTKENLIYLDSPRFEKEFVVYGDDPVEARYLLSHTMMEAILKFRKQVGVPVYFSFSNSKLYIGLEYGSQQHFEPNINTSLFDDDSLKTYLDLIENLMSIVKIFKLNEYLWSKYPNSKKVEQDKKVMQEEIPKENSVTPNVVQATKETNYNELYNSYYENIKAILNPLERKRYLTFLFQSIFVLCCAGLYVALYLVVEKYLEDKVFEVMSVSAILLLFAIIYGVFTISNTYTNKYQNQVIKPLFSYLNQSFVHENYRRISNEDVYKAKLFRDWSFNGGSNYFSGQINSIDIVATHMQLEIDNNTIFQGYFFILDMKKFPNKEFRLFPDGYEFDTQDDSSIDIRSNMNEHFDKNFKVYGNPTDANSILNESVCKSFVYFDEELDIQRIYLSYQKDKIYLGFYLNDSRFLNVSTIDPVYENKDIKFFIHLYGAVEDMIKAII